MSYRWIALAIIILLVSGFVYLTRGFIELLFIVPLWELLSVARLTLRSMPQGLIWAVFLVVLAALSLRTFFALDRRRRSPPPPFELEGSWVAGLARSLERAAYADYFAWRMAQEMARLALSAFAYGQPRETNSQERLPDELPEHIRSYLEAGLRRRTSLRLSSEARRGEPPPTLDELETFVSYLESRWEVPGER